ncbi:biotin transporter BioY [Pediococcus argentinicus]|nr:biotin transporter BioY [Pediococcus argentinicus]NKZ22851.1 biotin transporter BioY [Pediococcus argentinicus]GEP19926.1 BioY family transporter [Pediococcus argentinicus]
MRNQTTNMITRAALLLAFLIAMAFIPPINLGFLPVPLAVQSFGIVLISLLLPLQWVFYTIGSFLILVLLGVPVLTGMRGGAGLFVGPTAGYLIGYLLCSLILAWWSNDTDELWITIFKTFLVTALGLNFIGAIGMHFTTGVNLPKAIMLCSVFIIGDTLKSIVASLVWQRLKIRR